MEFDISYIERFRNYLIEEEKGALTIEKYVRDVKQFAKFIKDDVVTKVKLLEYKNILIEKYTPSSVNSIISSLNSFFEFCEQPNLKLKLLKIQRKIFVNKEKELTKQEYERLLRAAMSKHSMRLYYIMQTICSTGIRVGELKYLTVDSLDKGQMRIAFKGKVRVVILTKKLCRLLKKYVKINNIKAGSVFVTKTGKPLDRSNIWADMKKLCKKAGVRQEKVFPHNLRHLFARTYYSIEKDIVRLADILGHTNINTTRIYTIETGDIHRKQLEKLGLLQMT